MAESRKGLGEKKKSEPYWKTKDDRATNAVEATVEQTSHTRDDKFYMRPNQGPKAKDLLPEIPPKVAGTPEVDKEEPPPPDRALQDVTGDEAAADESAADDVRLSYSFKKGHQLVRPACVENEPLELQEGNVELLVVQEENQQLLVVQEEIQSALVVPDENQQLPHNPVDVPGLHQVAQPGPLKNYDSALADFYQHTYVYE